MDAPYCVGCASLRRIIEEQARTIEQLAADKERLTRAILRESEQWDRRAPNSGKAS